MSNGHDAAGWLQNADGSWAPVDAFGWIGDSDSDDTPLPEFQERLQRPLRAVAASTPRRR